MNYTKLDDYAHFEDDPAKIEQLFLNEDMQQLLDQIKDEGARQKAKDEIFAAVQQFLRELQQDEINQPEGGLKVLVKDRHIQLREMLLKIGQVGIPVIAKLILTGGASGGEVAAAGVKAAASTRGLIQKLDDSELDTCEAILRVIARKQLRVLAIHKASLEEVEAIFEGDRELQKPDDLKGMLEDLHKRNVLGREVVGGTAYYSIIF